MIELYSWATPNGHKIHIMLEECGLEYHVVPVDIGAGDQFKPDFLRISPNNKIPAIIDSDGPDGNPISLFESGAILLYLAGKTGRFLGDTAHEKYHTLQWLMFQMAGVGPMSGQLNYFGSSAPETIPLAIERYTNEVRRLYGVMNKQLAQTTYLAGNEYTIADIATFPWARSSQNRGMDWTDFPHVQRWFDTINERPAVQRGLKILADLRKPAFTKEEKEVLYGSKQYQPK